MDTFLRAAEAADDEVLKQKTIDVNKLVLPTSYTLLEKKYGTSVKAKSQGRKSYPDENENLLSESTIERESLSYRETLEVIVDIPWESLERVSGQTNLKRFIKLPMVLNVLAAALLASLGLVIAKVLSEIAHAGEMMDQLPEWIIGLVIVLIVMPTMQLKLVQAMMYYQ